MRASGCPQCGQPGFKQTLMGIYGGNDTNRRTCMSCDFSTEVWRWDAIMDRMEDHATVVSGRLLRADQALR